MLTIMCPTVISGCAIQRYATYSTYDVDLRYINVMQNGSVLCYPGIFVCIVMWCYGMLHACDPKVVKCWY